MSQRDLEGLLGRLLTDRSVRQRFFELPEETVRDESYDVTAREVGALLRLDEEDLEIVARRVDGLARPAPSPRPVASSDDEPQGMNPMMPNEGRAR